jgi:DNA (cytosine-5)-methyltransferase 1
MSANFEVIDLFAGPGGLGEGFSAYRTEDGFAPFQIRLSVEKEASAFRTLRLRSFLRKFGNDFPDDYYTYLAGQITHSELTGRHIDQWAAASEETQQLELGTKLAEKMVDQRLDEVIATGHETVVIGGRESERYSCAHPRDSHRPREKGILSRTLVSGGYH